MSRQHKKPAGALTTGWIECVAKPLKIDADFDSSAKERLAGESTSRARKMREKAK